MYNTWTKNTTIDLEQFPEWEQLKLASRHVISCVNTINKASNYKEVQFDCEYMRYFGVRLAYFAEEMKQKAQVLHRDDHVREEDKE